MAAVGTQMASGNALNALAKTATQITTTGLTFTCKSVIVQAQSTNEGTVVVGDKEVVAEQGAHEAAIKRRGIALAANESIAIDIADPREIWIDTTKNKEGVTWLALEA